MAAKGQTEYPPQMLARIVELRGTMRKGDWEMIAKTVSKEFGIPITSEKCRSRFRDHVPVPPVAEDEPTFNQYDNAVCRLFYDDKRQVREMHWSEQLHGFRDAQEFRDDHDIHQHTAKVRVDAKGPIAICDLSDLHIGSPYTDYVTLERDLSALKADTRFYLLKGGDWVDKFMPGFKSAVASMKQLHPALIQMLTAENILRDFDGRIIAAIDGNHEEMDAKYTGIETEYFVHRGKPYPYLRHGGLVELTVGAVTYRILWKHNYGYTSALNPSNSHRWLRMLAEGVDIAILEHIHNPMTQSRVTGGFADNIREVVDIRTGSYKIDDDFSVKKFKPGAIGPGVAVLFPDRRVIVPFNGSEALRHAQVYMDGLKKGTTDGKTRRQAAI